MVIKSEVAKYVPFKKRISFSIGYTYCLMLFIKPAIIKALL